MRYLLLTLTTIIIMQQYCMSQVDESRKFVCFFSDSVIYGIDVEFESRFWGVPYIRVDSIKISPNSIKFYKNNSGFYGNTIDNSRSGANFIPRIKKGKISLFSGVAIDYGMGYSGPGLIQGYYPTVRTTYFYSKNFENLKEVKYDNLISDLSDNEKSIEILTKYEKAKKRQKYIILSSAIIIISSVYYTSSISRNNYVTSLAIGTALIGGGITINLDSRKHKYLISAIDTYNY